MFSPSLDSTSFFSAAGPSAPDRFGPCAGAVHVRVHSTRRFGREVEDELASSFLVRQVFRTCALNESSFMGASRTKRRCSGAELQGGKLQSTATRSLGERRRAARRPSSESASRDPEEGRRAVSPSCVKLIVNPGIRDETKPLAARPFKLPLMSGRVFLALNADG